MPRLSSWGLGGCQPRAHHGEASFHLKLNPERQCPWGGSGWGASRPVSVLWRRRWLSQMEPRARCHLPAAADFSRMSSQHRHRGARWLGRSQRGDSTGLAGAAGTGLGVAGGGSLFVKQ